MPPDKDDERIQLLGDGNAKGDAHEKPYQPANALCDPAPNRKRIFVLCFDGTGNKFQGTDADSNILKIFRMLDRRDGSQFSYYQPGIGTYVTSGSLSHTSHWQRFSSWYAKTKDSAIGTSFAEHVMGGYKFLMRYYLPGDEIYFFGFSRGAYIARFLAEMLDHVGLLTAGNEEMARFAWKTFQKWQTRTERNDEEKKEKSRLRDYMCAFRETFSRPVRRIRFLGLFDTVNSVPAFEGPWMKRSKFPYTARSTARVIRHAVAIDERRAKFRQDLISEVKKHTHRKHQHLPYRGHVQTKPSVSKANVTTQDSEPDAAQAGQERRNQFNRDLQVPRPFRDSSEISGLRSLSPGLSSRQQRRGSRSSFGSVSRVSSNVQHSGGYDSDEEEQDIQEVWFAGCHADIGGGWGLETDEEATLSHVPLVWMVREAQRAGLRFDENKLRALNCCPDEEEEYIDLPTRDDDNDHQATAGAAPPEIQISAATPPLDGRSRSYLGPLPKLNNGTISTTNGNQASEGGKGDTEHQEHSKRFHALIHSSATAGKIHDVLCFNNGASHLSVFSWNCMEWIPFRRMDLTNDGSWRSIAWPLPKGEVRDVPNDVAVHHTVLRRMQHDKNYRPGNLIIGGGGRGVRKAPEHVGMGKWKVFREEGDAIGEVWVRA
ncbi:short chain dehydrogenase reductase family [Diplodia corticola]|uniref:Short chain dehydrogenase reductase family n=1 Tax=Diplodia corticola TaxID=236234 RepID=A0A1J9S511_9PEZI|nr:short chain dehydrogenase reductase family [Diplodia corticola]OJD35036.1 short chain dehydrogenase reductase family [Diplodia corticola]